MGYILCPGELRMDPSKVTAIAEWPEPKTVKDVQSFLGFANFYQRFIEKYSQKVTPLTNLTKKGATFSMEQRTPTSVQSNQGSIHKRQGVTHLRPGASHRSRNRRLQRSNWSLSWPTKGQETSTCSILLAKANATGTELQNT